MTDFNALRQRELAAERAARRAALSRGQLVIGPPGPEDGLEVAATFETRVESLAGAPRWARDARNEAVRILIDGALIMAQTGLRVEGRPAGKPPAEQVQRKSEKPAPRPVRTKTATKPPKPRKAPQKAAERPHKAKIRPARMPRPERPAPPDEVRCLAINSKGTRCKLEVVANGRCLLHSTAG